MDQKLSSFLAVGRLCAMNGSGLFLIFFNRVGDILKEGNRNCCVRGDDSRGVLEKQA